MLCYFVFVMDFIKGMITSSAVGKGGGGSGEVQLQLGANPSWQARVADCEVLLPRNRSQCWSYVILFCSVDLHSVSRSFWFAFSFFFFKLWFKITTKQKGWIQIGDETSPFVFLFSLIYWHTPDETFAFSLLVPLASRPTCTYFKHSPAFCHLLSLFLSVPFFFISVPCLDIFQH